MSVSNIYVGADHILCLTDTVVYVGNEPFGLCKTKSFVAADEAFALSYRGTTSFGRFIAKTLPYYTNVDLLENDIHHLPQIIGDEPFKASHGEITLMGWSEKHNQLRAIRFELRSGGVPVEVEVLEPGLHLGPAVRNAKLPELVDEAIMVKLALAQHKVAAHFGWPMCIGGLMHLTTVTKDGATQRITGSYPGYADLAERFGCPNADEYQGIYAPQEEAA